MKKPAIALLGLVTVLSALPGASASASSNAPKSTIAVFGDSPYGGTCTTTAPDACPVSAQLAATDAFVDLINSEAQDAGTTARYEHVTTELWQRGWPDVVAIVSDAGGPNSA